MTHIAWLGKKSPFCGNVTYGLTTTEALRDRGHDDWSFYHLAGIYTQCSCVRGVSSKLSSNLAVYI